MMMRTHCKLMVSAIVLAVASAAVAAEIPPRPEQLTFPPLTFKVPDAKAMRVKLANGVVAYVASDRMLPLVNVSVMFRGGAYLEKPGQEGLAELTGTVWRSGGAGQLDAKALDEELDFLAAQLSTGVGSATGSVSLNLLSKDLDRGLALLIDVLKSPRFEQARLDKAKEDMIAEMKRRNDETSDIEAREWERLIFGDDYFLCHYATKRSVDAISRNDLLAFHKLLANPANFVVAVSGDFDRSAMIAKLDATLGAWKPTGPAVGPVPQPKTSAAPGVYIVNKPDVNQARVSIGHIGARRPLADEQALDVANDILGGGGFTSWITKRVRSDEGLAYTARSFYGVGDLYPGTFRAYFQTKSATCAFAAGIVKGLVEKIRTATVSPDELSTSKNGFVERFPRTFEGTGRTVARFAQDELLGRPATYWTGYRDRVKAVDAAAVRAAAAAHIDPARLIVLVVGNADEILKGHPDHPNDKLEAFGKITRLPLRDPLTLEPVK
jgi:zinc protease